jgi:hypothetical protein
VIIFPTFLTPSNHTLLSAPKINSPQASGMKATLPSNKKLPRPSPSKRPKPPPAPPSPDENSGIVLMLNQPGIGPWQQIVVPALYTGGWQYAPQNTYHHSLHVQSPANFYQQGNRHLHDHNVAAGHGYPAILNDPVFLGNGLYNPNWMVTPTIGFGWKTSNRTTGDCNGCSFKLVNPDRPNTRVKYCQIVPGSGVNNYRRYAHYSCFNSNIFDYNQHRYNALVCIHHPNALEWVVSTHGGHQMAGRIKWEKWSWCEELDLVVAVRMSGQLTPAGVLNIDWTLVHPLLTVLQHRDVNARTTKQLKQKFVKLLQGNRLNHYFAAGFQVAGI